MTTNDYKVACVCSVICACLALIVFLQECKVDNTILFGSILTGTIAASMIATIAKFAANLSIKVILYPLIFSLLISLAAGLGIWFNHLSN